MSKSIVQLIDELPSSNMTTLTLKALDFAVPGQWQNIVGFENMIREVTGETDDDLIEQIKDRAVELYNDQSEGYQKAIWLYQTIDNADTALGTAAIANKIGEKVSFLGFLNKVTPNADKAQTIDLVLKIVVELIAFCQINGLPGDNIGDFAKSLTDYKNEGLMRLAGLVCIDGLLPLGPDFLQKVGETLDNLSDDDLTNNGIFQKISDLIPGGSKTPFIVQSFQAIRGWLDSFVRDRGLSPQVILKNLSQWVEIADDKLDYIAAFLDMSTNYYEHTGVQTVARRLIERAYAEI